MDPKTIAQMGADIADLRRRMDTMFRHGPVKEVDTETQRARIAMGKGVDGQEQLSPWIPYAQQAGALKIHTAPSVGQNMTMLAPNGDPEQALLMPFTWNQGNPSPSSSAAENVLTFGDVKLVVTESSVVVTIGGFSVTLTAGGLDALGGLIKHDEKNIGSTHTHGGVRSGAESTSVPNG